MARRVFDGQRAGEPGQDGGIDLLLISPFDSGSALATVASFFAAGSACSPTSASGSRAATDLVFASRSLACAASASASGSKTVRQTRTLPQPSAKSFAETTRKDSSSGVA